MTFVDTIATRPTLQLQRHFDAPRPLVFEFDLDGVEPVIVALQLFVDDFQSKRMGSRFRAWLDGTEAGDLAVTLNALDQTGPIGKLLTLQLLPEYLDLVRDGKLVVRIDDPDNDAGDGYAFDFARLLINPKGYKYTGTVRGIAVDTGSGRPLAGVLVSAANVRQALTDAQGRFTLEDVPAGLVVTSGSKPGYTGDSEAEDLVAGETLELVLELAPLETDSGSLAEQLERERKVDLYGIYFDTAKATLKPESEATLQQVRGVLTSDPSRRLVNRRIAAVCGGIVFLVVLVSIVNGSLVSTAITAIDTRGVGMGVVALGGGRRGAGLECERRADHAHAQRRADVLPGGDEVGQRRDAAARDQQRDHGSSVSCPSASRRKGWGMGVRRQRPVTDSGAAMMSATVPWATTVPPRTPAPGPMSMTCSARRMVSSSCSTTTSVLPDWPSVCRASSSSWLSRGCRPMVGSSST